MRRAYLIGVFVFLLGSPVQSAITYIQSTSCGNGAASTACTYSSNITAGSLLITQCGSGSANGQTMTDNNGNTWNKMLASDLAQNNGTGTRFENVWYVLSANAGATTVTCSCAGASSTQVNLHEYSVTNAPAIFDQASSSSPAAFLVNPASGFINISVANEFVFSGANFEGAHATSGSGTSRTHFVDWYWSDTQDAVVGPVGSYQSTFTMATAAHWVMVQGSFLESNSRGQISTNSGSGKITSGTGTGSATTR